MTLKIDFFKNLLYLLKHPPFFGCLYISCIERPERNLRSFLFGIWFKFTIFVKN